MPPSADGAVIAARERNPINFVEAEQADTTVFFTDTKCARVASMQAVGDDNHVPFREHLVHPAIQ